MQDVQVIGNRWFIAEIGAGSLQFGNLGYKLGATLFEFGEFPFCGFDEGGEVHGKNSALRLVGKP